MKRVSIEKSTSGFKLIKFKDFFKVFGSNKSSSPISQTNSELDMLTTLRKFFGIPIFS